MDIFGLMNFGVFFLSLAGIYAILALGLNVQWGFTGILNVGIVAFFAVGAYAAAILTSVGDFNHLGGYELPMAIGIFVAMLVSGAIAWLIGLITLRLRSDYLAIASIGIAEIVRLGLKNESWATGGVRGFPGVPVQFNNIFGQAEGFLFLLLVVAVLFLVYLGCEWAYRSPWGRVQRAIRENETAARAMGKNVLGFRLQSFVLGAMIMGLSGALYAHFVGFISPEAFDPFIVTFIVWVMLIAGGSGNNRGAVLGALVIWGVWSGTELITSNLLPENLATQGASLRVLLIGLLLQFILITRPQGMLPERVSRPEGRGRNK